MAVDGPKTNVARILQCAEAIRVLGSRPSLQPTVARVPERVSAESSGLAGETDSDAANRLALALLAPLLEDHLSGVESG